MKIAEDKIQKNIKSLFMVCIVFQLLEEFCRERSVSSACNTTVSGSAHSRLRSTAFDSSRTMGTLHENRGRAIFLL